LTLDVLRGVALFGVVISNMLWFSGLVFRFPAYRAETQGLSLDSVVYHVVAVLVSGKAIATLSFLFGLGFAVQMMRAQGRGLPVLPLYCRRLAVMFAIGLAHVIFLWYGDILTLYAMLGFVLIFFARRSDRTVLVTAGILLIALPLAMGLSTMSPWQFSATTLGLLSAFALTLAILGVYGSVSGSVIQRRREIAIRSTLGALPRDIVRLVLREGVLLTAIGIAAGLTISIGVTRALAGLLFGVRPLDPGTLAGTAALFVCVSLASMLLPVGRALRVDPAATLKQE
jgi:uncharacterized membrane protein YeiB